MKITKIIWFPKCQILKERSWELKCLCIQVSMRWLILKQVSVNQDDLPRSLQLGWLFALPFSIRKKTESKKIKICANRPTLLLLNSIYTKTLRHVWYPKKILKKTFFRLKKFVGAWLLNPTHFDLTIVVLEKISWNWNWISRMKCILHNYKQNSKSLLTCDHRVIKQVRKLTPNY